MLECFLMYGEPEDVEGQCNARLFIGDNFGDNHATMRCQLEPGHAGLHREVFREGRVRVEWDEDERKKEESDEELWDRTTGDGIE